MDRLPIKPYCQEPCEPARPGLSALITELNKRLDEIYEMLNVTFNSAVKEGPVRPEVPKQAGKLDQIADELRAANDRVKVIGDFIEGRIISKL